MYPTSARFREAIKGSHRAVVRVWAMSTIQFGANPTGGLELPIRSGDIKLGSTSDVKGTLDLTVVGDYYDSLEATGVEIFVQRGIDYGDGTSELVPCGYYRVQSIDQDEAPFGPVKVSARDRIAQMQDARLLYPYSYPAGTTHRQLFERLINAAESAAGVTHAYGMYLSVKVPIVFTGYDPDKAALPAGTVQDSIYEHLAKIADARSCILRFDRLGQLKVESRERPPGELSVYRVEPGTASGNLIRASRHMDRAGVYNIVVARGSDPAFPTGYRLAYNNDPDSPLRWTGPFGAVPRYYASPLLRTSDQADAAAETVLARYKGLPTNLSVVTVPDPSLDPLDPITIVLGGAAQEHLIDDITIPLSISQPVTIATRALNVVPEDTGEGGGVIVPPPGNPPDPGSPPSVPPPGGGGGAPGLPIFPAKFRDGADFPWFDEPAGQQVVPVANTSELTSKVAAAVPGQTLVLSDGTYSPGTLTISKVGLAARPIVVKALNKGGAKFASTSGIRLTGQFILVKNLVKEFDSSGKSFAIEGAAKNCGYDGCSVGPNSLAAADAAAEKSLHYYVGGDSDRCFITFCESKNKSKPGNGVLVDGNFTTFKACTHILIDHMDIHDYGTQAVNDFEAIRYGVSTMQTTVVNSAIIRCVFTNILSEPEVISHKATAIDSWGHTVDRCIGALTIRHGDDNYLGHFYVTGPATGSLGLKAGGARVYGKRNRIEEFYIEATNGVSYESAITLDGGDTTAANNQHQANDGTKVTNGLIVNCATAIVVGEHYSIAPKNVTIRDNTVVNSGGAAVRTIKAPTGTNTISNNQHFDTITAAGLTGPTGGAYRLAGRGPRLTRLTRAEVGPNGDRTDGTGKSVGGAPGGTPPPPVGTRVQAARLILDRLRGAAAGGPPIFEDWTWPGSPQLVNDHNDALLNELHADGITDSFSQQAIDWLALYVGETGGGTQPPPPGPSPATSIASLLKIGSTPGFAHFDIGVGFAPGDDRGPNADGSGTTSSAVHRNYPQSRIASGLSIPGYFELTSDRTAAKLSAHLDGGKTSERTEYARVEFREYEQNGTTKIAFNPNNGRHYIIHRFRVTRKPPNKPELVLVQYHDADDDTSQVRLVNTSVIAKLGDTQVVGTLKTGFQLGTVYTAMIEIQSDGNGKSRLRWYWDDMTTPKLTSAYAARSTGWYGKGGSYAQSNDLIDNVEDGPFIVETLGLGHWHSVSPGSSSPWAEPLGLKP